MPSMRFAVSSHAHNRTAAVRQRGAVITAWVVAMLLASAPVAHAATTASTTVADETIPRGGSTAVTLEVTGETVTEATPTDIMLVLDESGSVSPTQFGQMKAFASSLVTSLGDRGLFDNGGRTGLAMFATSARLVRSLTDSQGDMLTAIDGVNRLGGWTCIGCGLQVGTDQLTQSADPDRNRITVLLTDGHNNRPSGYPGGPAQHLADQVAAAQAAGIERFAIGVGAFNQAELESIASDPMEDHVFTLEDFDDLEGIVGPLVESLDKPAATNVEITATVAAGFTATAPDADMGTVTQAGNQLVWTMDSLGAETATLTYTVEHDADLPCAQGVPVHDSITYADEEGAAVTFPLGAVDVTGCPPELLADLLDYVTGKGAGNSLRATVLAAQRAEDRGDIAAACNQLQALINQVSAQTPTHLSVEEADWITTAATDIRAALGC